VLHILSFGALKMKQRLQAYAVVLGCLLMGSPPAVAEVYIVNGGVQDLIDTLEEANTIGGGHIIRLSGQNFVFSGSDRLPAITSFITLEGPATFTEADPGDSVERLFLIEPDAYLELDGLQFSNFNLGREGVSEPLIENHGELLIDVSQFVDINGSRNTNPLHGVRRGRDFLVNHGELSIRSSAFIHVGLGNSRGGLLRNFGEASLDHVYTIQDRLSESAPLANEGQMTLRNVTMAGSEVVLPADRPLSNRNGTVLIANSIFDQFKDGWCDEVTSLGSNMVVNGVCEFAAPGDLVNIPSGLLPPTDVSPGNPHSPFKPIPVRSLSASSAAIDSADPDHCRWGDILGNYSALDGDGDGLAICDRGAIELKPRILSEGGLTGFYYDDKADGHYVYILDNVHNTLVTWNTVDRNGNQAWVYGVGQISGRQSLTARAYINFGGFLTDDGPVDIEEATEWGTLQVEMDSCYKGRVFFDSDLPEFGSGSFEITRLAYSRQIGCAD